MLETVPKGDQVLVKSGEKFHFVSGDEVHRAGFPTFVKAARICPVSFVVNSNETEADEYESCL